MNYKVFSIRDTKAEVFNPPFFKSTHGEAERDFRSLCNDPKSMPNKYPDDFELYYVGDFDDQTGLMSPTSVVQSVIHAKNCIPTA